MHARGDYTAAGTSGFPGETEESRGRAATGAMVHLEQRNKLTKTFRNPFRKPGWKQWKIDHTKPYEIPADIAKEYMGRMEDKEGRVETDEDPFSPLND